jgi:hypothetical protein
LWQDLVVAIETQAGNLRRLKALYIDCGEKDQFNLLYGVRRFVRRLNEFGIAHRYEEFPDNPYRRRLSDGRELAVPRSGGVRLTWVNSTLHSFAQLESSAGR